MAVIAVTPETSDIGELIYRAVDGRRHSIGRTPGQALDALANENEPNLGEAVYLSQLRMPDRFFSAAQQERLAELMLRRKSADTLNAELSVDEYAELEALVQAELQAAIDRTAALSQALQS